MLILVCGKSGTGKSAIVKELINLGYTKVVTDTTRPPRRGEEHGIDYYFDSEEEFDELLNEGEFLEISRYNTRKGLWRYGTTRGAVADAGDKAVIILNPSGLKKFRKKKVEMKVVLVESSEDTILDRLAIRGDEPTEIVRRMDADNKDFEDIDQYIDYKITNENGDNLKDIAQQIVDLVK